MYRIKYVSTVVQLCANEVMTEIIFEIAILVDDMADTCGTICLAADK